MKYQSAFHFVFFSIFFINIESLKHVHTLSYTHKQTLRHQEWGPQVGHLFAFSTSFALKGYFVVIQHKLCGVPIWTWFHKHHAVVLHMNTLFSTILWVTAWLVLINLCNCRMMAINSGNIMTWRFCVDLRGHRGERTPASLASIIGALLATLSHSLSLSLSLCFSTYKTLPLIHCLFVLPASLLRSEEHTSELQSR